MRPFQGVALHFGDFSKSFSSVGCHFNIGDTPGHPGNIQNHYQTNPDCCLVAKFISLCALAKSNGV